MTNIVLLRSHFFQRRSISIRSLKKIVISIGFDFHTGQSVRHAKYLRWSGRDARSPRRVTQLSAQLLLPPRVGRLSWSLGQSAPMHPSRSAHELGGMAPSGSATSMWTVEHLQSGSTCQYTRYCWATRGRGQLGILEGGERGGGRRWPSTSVGRHPIRLKPPTCDRHYHCSRR